MSKDLKISEMMDMQMRLWEKHKDKWQPMESQFGKISLLWMVEEMGEVISIIKKKGDKEIMNNPDVRKHFVEELSDVLMYYNDTLLRFGVTPEEISDAYTEKHEFDMKRIYNIEYKK